MASDGMSREDACELAGEMEDFLDIPAAVCESIERHLVDGDYECVCRYILGRRRAMADLVDPVARPVPVLASDDVNCPHCGTRIDWEEE